MEGIILLAISELFFLIGFFMAFKTIEQIKNNNTWHVYGLVTSFFISFAIVFSLITIASAS